MSAYRDRIAEVVAEIADAAPLPATVAELSDSERKALEVQARYQRLTPEALLAVARGQQAKERELRDTVDEVLAALRGRV